VPVVGLAPRPVRSEELRINEGGIE
jgi:hypothetical protein